MPCRAATPTRWLRHYLCETLRHNGEKMPVDDLIEFTSKRGIHNVDELYGRILPCVPLPLRRWRAPRGLRFAWGHQASRTWPTLPGVAHAQSSGTRRMRDRHTHRFTPKLEPAPDRWVAGCNRVRARPWTVQVRRVRAHNSRARRFCTQRRAQARVGRQPLALGAARAVLQAQHDAG